jgi:tetratricopeptide (TPR) repeat protein
MSCRCDQCGVEGAKSAFKYCAACREAIYCSPECQRTHWKAGHKHKCVKQVKADAPAAPPPIPPPPPPIAVGAAVVIGGIVSQPSLNGSRGSVTGGPDPETGRWAVRCAVDGKSRKLKPANLEVPLGGGAQSGGGGGGGGKSAAAGGEEECTICLEALQQPQTMPCGHRFCRGCVTSMLQYGVGEAQVCPLCRAPMPGGQGLYHDASALLTQYNKRFPLAQQSVERLRLLGNKTTAVPAEAMGLLAKATDLFRQSLAANPEEGAHCCNFGIAYSLQERGDFEGALRAYRLAASSGTSWQVHVRMGYLYQATGDTASAETAFRAAMAADPTNASTPRFLGDLLLSRGEYSDAEPLYHLSICLGRIGDTPPSELAAAHTGMGTVLLKRGDTAGAVAANREAVAVDPHLVAGQGNLGITLEQHGDHAGAEAAFRAVLAIDPRFVPGHLGLGRVMKARAHQCVARADQQGASASIRAAKAAYVAALNIDTRCVEAYGGLGAVLGCAGDHAGAASAFAKALAIDPTDASAQQNLQLSLQCMQQQKEKETAEKAGHS